MSDAAARVIRTLRESREPCSGEELSEALGVSRAAVWKQVERLRERGYVIEGAAGGGYQLKSAPDRLYPEEVSAPLETRWLAQSFEHFDELDSTNRLALERAREGAAHGHTIVAETQTAGRGRLGRSFYSPPNRNLYSSTILRPKLDTGAAPTLIPASAVAVADAIAEEVGSDDGIEIKWPNDVLLGGRKTCGILMEMTVEATQVGAAVLGIGVNLNVDPEEFPEEFRSLATSLCAFAGRPINRAAFARRLYRRMESVLDLHAAAGFEALRKRYEAYFAMPGRRITVTGADGRAVHGVAVGIDDGAALLFERDDGARERVLAGDVTLSRR